MKKIEVYDYEADRIEKICEELDTTEAEVIEALFKIADYNEEYVSEYV